MVPRSGHPHEFWFDIKMGLRKGLAQVPGMRRALTEEEQERVVGEINAQFRYGWKIEEVRCPVGPGLHAKTGEMKPE